MHVHAWMPPPPHSPTNAPIEPSPQKEGRDLLRRRQTDILRMLLPQLQSSNAVRRRGVASTIRNCCFEGAWVRGCVGGSVGRLVSQSVPRPALVIR